MSAQRRQLTAPPPLPLCAHPPPRRPSPLVMRSAQAACSVQPRIARAAGRAPSWRARCFPCTQANIIAGRSRTYLKATLTAEVLLRPSAERASACAVGGRKPPAPRPPHPAAFLSFLDFFFLLPPAKSRHEFTRDSVPCSHCCKAPARGDPRVSHARTSAHARPAPRGFCRARPHARTHAPCSPGASA